MAKMYNNILEWAEDNKVKLSSKDTNLIVNSGGITSLKDATPANYYQMGVEPTNENYKDMYKEIKKQGDKMAEKPNKEMMQPAEQPQQEDAFIQQMDELDSLKREMSKEYAPYFKELNWLKAISPNLEFKPFGNQGEVK
jgi:hypothetical protein